MLDLIDKPDSFEIVRDKIAAILVTEVAGQMAQATSANKNPQDWKLRIFTERANPWEVYLNDAPGNKVDKSPIVNIWYDSSTFDEKKSNVVERQKSESIFNIDCYGFGVSRDITDGGHASGDSAAAFQVHKAIRLVRNILMAGEYTYVGLRGSVWKRWIREVKTFQPQDGAERPIQHIVAARIIFQVDFNEFSPQVKGELLEYISTTIKRAETGEIYLTADYDFTS